MKFTGWDSVPVMMGAIALVVSYFTGPMLNFGDFSRYGKTFEAVKKGNFWGLPVNFVFFSLLTVVTTAATLPVFGELITDPVHTVGKLDSGTAVVIGALTFMIATIGINIVANFVSPAFDFSNVAPQHICWRTGGMIAAVGSVFLTPWNLYNNPEVIHYTLDILGAFIGPLFGILIADFYIVQKQRVKVDDLYSMETERPLLVQERLQPQGDRGADPGGADPDPVRAGADPARRRATTPGSSAWASGSDLSTIAAPPTARADGWQTHAHQGHQPNTSRSMTQKIGACAQAVADAGTTIVAVNPSMGPASIESHYDEAMALPGLLAEIMCRRARGRRRLRHRLLRRPGLKAARELARGPVVGIAEAAMHTASFLGGSFSVVTTLARTIGMA